MYVHTYMHNYVIILYNYKFRSYTKGVTMRDIIINFTCKDNRK